MTLRRRNQRIIHLARGPEVLVRRVGRKRKDEDDHDDDHRVHVIRNERRLDAAEQRVQDHTDREQETGRSCVNTSQRRHDGRAAGQQHGRDQDVGHQAEDDEDDVHGGAVAGANRFEECVRVGGSSFELDGEGCE